MSADGGHVIHPNRLTTAIDRFVEAVRVLVPPGTPPQTLAAFDVALGDLLAETLSAASAQSAGATLQLLEGIHQRLADLEERGPGAFAAE